jgi:polyphosphate kinase 2 (PPK2 family)
MNKVANKNRKSEDTNVPALKRKEYEEKLHQLHIELVKLQEWVKREGKKVCVVFGARRIRPRRFLNIVPSLEKTMVDSGIVLLKYWLEVTPEEQTNRLTARIDGKRKIWKLSQMDLDSYTRWDDYTRARDDMFQATDTA